MRQVGLLPNTAAQLKITTRLILVRHGETEWNRLGRWQGKSDVPLNARGREQAARLAHSLKGEKLAAVYCSVLSRAVETAQIVAVVHRLNVCRDARLNEIDTGEWEGLTIKEMARYGDAYRRWMEKPEEARLPGGETIADVQRRVLPVIREIAGAYPGETVCVVAHGVVNAVVRSHYLGLTVVEALRSEAPPATAQVLDIPLILGSW